MSQSGVTSIDPATTSGPDLATLLVAAFIAIYSQHSGTTRPSYFTGGTIGFWVDITTGTAWVLNWFDGSDDNPVLTLNPSTGALTLPVITVGNASAGGHALNRTTADARYALLATGYALLGSDNEFTGAQLFDGDLTFGNATGDNITFTGTVISTLNLLGSGVSLTSKASGAGTNPLIGYNSSGTFSGNVVQALADRTSNSGFNFYKAIADNNGSADGKFKVRGDGLVFADGAYAATGGDRAEMFEWDDGNPDGFDGSKTEVGSNRVGLAVALVGHKIKIAGAGDRVIGVVSVTFDTLGNAAPLNHHGRYLRDDFGLVIREDHDIVSWDVDEVYATFKGKRLTRRVSVSFDADRLPSGVKPPPDATITVARRPKLNPSFDASLVDKYRGREERKEWDAIAQLGRIRVRKGQSLPSKWIKLRDISDAVEEWLIPPPLDDEVRA